MTDLLSTIASRRPREKAGAHTMNRYGFQIHISILKMLEMHQAGRDYRAAFDFFDDLLVFDKSHSPEKVELFQIKTKLKGEWTMANLRAAAGEGPKPRSFIGKMHSHMAVFGDAVESLGFVTNLTFKMKLKGGGMSTTDHVVIRSEDLHGDEIGAIKATAASDCETPSPHDGSDRFVFESSPLGLREQDVFVRGRIGDYLAWRSTGDQVPKAVSFYEMLSALVLHRTNVSQGFASADEFYERKTLCRADIEAMFAQLLSGRRFHDNWPSVQADLLASGVSGREAIVIHTACIRYTTARSIGEPGAMAFNAAAQGAIVGRDVEVTACAHLRDMVNLLDKWIPEAYENRQGALYVEAFEALQ
jgi:hypothetical protein